VNGAPCARKWQVEAIRDGRLIGKDLESAIRHRETCAECAEEERELSALGHELAHLPDIGRDEVSVQRSRQRLMAAHNETVVDPPRRGVPLRGASALALALAAAGWFVFLHRQTASSSAKASREIVEVHAQLGARWTKHQEAARIWVDFEDGVAAFEIHPHPGRSVIIRLPDGEVEDMGTVFDVRVAEQHTKHVAVREGRVSIHLNGRSAISLGAGETWDAEPAEVAPSAVVPDSNSAPPIPAAAPRPTAPKAGSAALARLEKPEPQGRASSTIEPNASAVVSAQSTKAEDDAYLHIVDLLRAGKDAEARAQAKDYLLRFPSGFRRIEVLNIATRGARDAGVDETRMH
jgi:ferric-dicitrate binding protein FerR (iron transport regulator)